MTSEEALAQVQEARQAVLDARRHADLLQTIFVDVCRQAREAGCKAEQVAQAAGMTRWALHQTTAVHSRPVKLDD